MAASESIKFYKYQAIGNNFIMIDNRDGHFSALSENCDFTSWMCDRHYGVGADGIIELRARDGYDFEMVYIREDSAKGYACGNGSRCLIAFAQLIQVPKLNGDGKFHFMGVDGEHVGWVDDVTNKAFVQMKDVKNTIKKYDDENFYINVGNHCHVCFVSNLSDIDVVSNGCRLAYESKYIDNAHDICIVIMFVQVEANGKLNTRAFETGINVEIMSCGTGAIASVLVNEFRKPWKQPEMKIRAEVSYKGGCLEVMCDRIGPAIFENVFLVGQAKRCYEGAVNLADFPLDYKYIKEQ